MLAAVSDETPSAGDELRHTPEADVWWGESWYFDAATLDGTAGVHLRLGLYPNQGRSWWWGYVVRDGEPVVVVRDHDAPLPSGGQSGLEVRTEGLWAELTCEQPHEHWSVGMEAFGVALEQPEEGYQGERGERVAVGFDLEWEAAAAPFVYPGTARYEQSCVVHGEVLIGRERFELAGPAQRDHSWGVRDWWQFPWTWFRAGFDDGTHVHGAYVTPPGFVYSVGYELAAGGAPAAAEFGEPQFALDANGFPTTATLRCGTTTVMCEPVGVTAIPLLAPDGRYGRMPRTLVRATTTDGRTGSGWLELNQPDPPR